MANNPYCNKVVLGDRTLIDLTEDTVSANRMLDGTVAHDATGAVITGTMLGVGSIYTTASDVNPAVTLGFGTWVKIRQLPMTWGQMKNYTWAELKEDTWGHDELEATVYMWKRTA